MKLQICRYDYPNLIEMKRVVEGVRGYGIPYDVQVSFSYCFKHTYISLIESVHNNITS